MKKIIFNVVVIVLSIFLILQLSVLVKAEGDTNMDGGGGGMGSGTADSRWSSGNDGVRVTIVNAESGSPVTTPIDITNITPASTIMHFGKVSKLSYSGSSSLSVRFEGYTYTNPNERLPTIISYSGSNNITAIRSYFTDEQVIRSIGGIVGMDYDEIICGDYKIVVEPIAYYLFQGAWIASTAHEGALYNEQLGGTLRTAMTSLTHQNQPFALFLEEDDLGYTAYTGATNAYTTDAVIKAQLGIGIVRFEPEEEPDEEPDEEPEIEPEIPNPPPSGAVEYEYRIDTEVVTSVWVSGGQSDPDEPTTVTFNILGRDYVISNIYYPDGDSQLVWVKWTTPDTEQNITITVTSTGTGIPETGTINVTLVDLNKNPPPNPIADDRNDSFRESSTPSNAEVTGNNWSVWSVRWSEELEEWLFTNDEYSATLTASMDIKNDEYNPTGTGYSIKSGYGVNQDVSARITTDQATAVSGTPNGISYFPEFGYGTYWRLLDRMSTGSSATLSFKENHYSTYNNRTHFTPVWYPDGRYIVYTYLIDYWTPAGMLSMNLTDYISIEGNLWDDWHIGPKAV